ncbi:MAG: peptidoglycan DD-metalloendopeptidase family protein [Vicingaceae bacterium]
MSRSFINRLFLLQLLLMLFAFSATAQSKQDLQAKKRKLQDEIQYTNQLLKETEKTKRSSLNQLRQLSKKISSREALIEAMEEEIVMINDSIQGRENQLDSLEENLNLLKDEYAEMIRNAYKNRSEYNRLMFIFSSSNFNQAFKRLKYFQQYAQYRESQAENIEMTQAKIDAQIRQLEAIKKSKEGLLKAKLNERNTLAQEKGQKENVVNDLKGKESQLKKELRAKEKAAKKITAAIEKIIAEEIRKAREAAKKAGKSEKGFPMTPEARELSNSFTANKGKLPWPVAEGVITGQFGEHPHPTLKDVKVQNNGIDISTKKGNMGRAIFEGTVSSIVIVPFQGKAVIVKHGDYFTLYSYFKEVFVATGDKVDTKQNMGVLIDDDDGASSTMHFELWKVQNKLNPEGWIFKK